MEFKWDAANIRHIARHRVRPDETEAAIDDPMQLGISAGEMDGEYRQAILGLTKEGRLLFVVYAERDGEYRVLQARSATRFEREKYRRQR